MQNKQCKSTNIQSDKQNQSVNKQDIFGKIAMHNYKLHTIRNKAIF